MRLTRLQNNEDSVFIVIEKQENLNLLLFYSNYILMHKSHIYIYKCVTTLK